MQKLTEMPIPESAASENQSERPLLKRLCFSYLLRMFRRKNRDFTVWGKLSHSHLKQIEKNVGTQSLFQSIFFLSQSHIYCNTTLQRAIFSKNILTERNFCATMQSVVLWKERPSTGQGTVFGSLTSLFFRFFPADLLRFLQNGPAYFTCSHQSRKHFRDHTCVNAQSALKKDSLRFIIQL